MTIEQDNISMRLVDLCLSWSSCIWQIYTSETLKQAEGVVSTVRCEGREHALGRGIKRKLDSIHSMHSTLHEDQDVSGTRKSERAESGQRKLEVGELVWGAARGNPAWPGKVESVSSPGTVWVRWYGSGGTRSQVEIKTLKSLSEGLEAHHRARKKFRKSRKLNMQLENAIQEAMAELDKMSEGEKGEKGNGKSCRITTLQSSKTVTSSKSKNEGKRKKNTTMESSKLEQKNARWDRNDKTLSKIDWNLRIIAGDMWMLLIAWSWTGWNCNAGIIYAFLLYFILRRIPSNTFRHDRNIIG